MSPARLSQMLTLLRLSKVIRDKVRMISPLKGRYGISGKALRSIVALHRAEGRCVRGARSQRRSSRVALGSSHGIVIWGGSLCPVFMLKNLTTTRALHTILSW